MANGRVTRWLQFVSGSYPSSTRQAQYRSGIGGPITGRDVAAETVDDGAMGLPQGFHKIQIFEIGKGIESPLAWINQNHRNSATGE